MRCAAAPLRPTTNLRVHDIPAGVILSRDADAWILAGDDRRHGDACLSGNHDPTLYVPSARGWISGTGLRAKWDYHQSRKSPMESAQYLMAAGCGNRQQGHRRFFSTLTRRSDIVKSLAARTSVRSWAPILPSLPCGHKVPILHLANSSSIDNLCRVRLRCSTVSLSIGLSAAGSVPPRLLGTSSPRPQCRTNLLHLTFHRS